MRTDVNQEVGEMISQLRGGFWRTGGFGIIWAVLGAMLLVSLAWAAIIGPPTLPGDASIEAVTQTLYGRLASAAATIMILMQAAAVFAWLRTTETVGEKAGEPSPKNSNPLFVRAEYRVGGSRFLFFFLMPWVAMLVGTNLMDVSYLVAMSTPSFAASYWASGQLVFSLQQVLFQLVLAVLVVRLSVMHLQPVVVYSLGLAVMLMSVNNLWLLAQLQRATLLGVSPNVVRLVSLLLLALVAWILIKPMYSSESSRSMVPNASPT